MTEEERVKIQATIDRKKAELKGMIQSEKGVPSKELVQGTQRVAGS